MDDLFKVWSSVGSAGTANAADLSKLVLENSVVQLGPALGGSTPRGTLENRPMRDTSKPANGTRQDRVSYSRFQLSKQGKSSPHSTELNYTVKT
jgi:hypothetical protein